MTLTMRDRVNLMVSSATVAALEQVASEMETTKSGILSDGVRIIREAVAAAYKGGQLAIVGADGTVSPLLGPWNDVKPRERVA